MDKKRSDFVAELAAAVGMPTALGAIIKKVTALGMPQHAILVAEEKGIDLLSSGLDPHMLLIVLETAVHRVKAEIEGRL